METPCTNSPKYFRLRLLSAIFAFVKFLVFNNIIYSISAYVFAVYPFQHHSSSILQGVILLLIEIHFSLRCVLMSTLSVIKINLNLA